ncbi:2-amino-4-hydroxy-6-hydroxymethyldihydropteridine diphosphokinase [Candidatus Deianiraea vastatrix]|uniref:2-amino-4-hydroxy-6-hydroxymethyldihydropteridine pyrophosphokinase n=1 Tax=Candidatus Deianiraea vastatrix TaxID=2163644 RepID=A0A5B8XGR6_9RICK|nr:2-amino-4-hydroxy-6-hydroxymethyldihydropteridine diphosphokinase [Candidatus Deianiraea vastatrix]QED23361.1 2-amino-4-hydroxy-6-hydroxymethyldihydropteridine pyrophosphokinase [Candidatus Deianiraea vastatrix]
MIIEINDICLNANLKCHYPWEKSDIQGVKIDCKIIYNTQNPKVLSDVIDYVKIENVILDIAKSNQFDIIEALAGAIADKILEKFEQITQIFVKITKENVMQNAKSVSIEIEKTQGVKVIFCLGSNLGDREKNINLAYKLLCEKLQLKMPKISSLIEYPAWMPEGSPATWNIDFLNCAVSGFCAKKCDEILQITQEIEQEIGRKKDRIKFSPREIDIDILYFDGKIISSKNLQIPHAQCYFRDFMLTPAREIEPDLIYVLK